MFGLGCDALFQQHKIAQQRTLLQIKLLGQYSVDIWMLAMNLTSVIHLLC